MATDKWGVEVSAGQPMLNVFGVTRCQDIVPKSLESLKINAPIPVAAAEAPLPAHEAYIIFRKAAEEYCSKHAPRAKVLTDFAAAADMMLLELHQDGETADGYCLTGVACVREDQVRAKAYERAEKCVTVLRKKLCAKIGL